MFRKNHPNKGSFCSRRSHCWNWTLAESKTQTKLNAENRKYGRGAGKSQRRPQHPATEGSPAARGESQRRPQNPVMEGSPSACAGVGTEACSCAPKINKVHPCSKNSAKHRGTIEKASCWRGSWQSGFTLTLDLLEIMVAEKVTLSKKAWHTKNHVGKGVVMDVLLSGFIIIVVVVVILELVWAEI